MKTFTKAVLIGGLLAGGLAAAGMTSALASPDEDGECHRGGHSMKMGRHMDGEEHFLDHMTRRLDLTKEQQASIQEILKKSDTGMRETRDKLRANHEALRKLADDGQADAKQVQKLAQEQGRLIAEQIVQRTQVHGEIQKLLTDAQREQLKEMRERHGRHFRG